jgi:hypothetical protein
MSKQEIKANSITVSLCMFAACDIHLLHNIADCIWTGKKADRRYYLQFTSGLGLSSTLILSTLFVKMLRVYSIFSNPFAHNKKFFSNSFPFACWTALLSSFLLCGPVPILWLTMKSILVLEGCLGTHPSRGLRYSCFMSLIIAMVVLAFKSSIIWYKNFRNIMTTNVFAFLSTMVIIMTTLHWWFFHSLEPSIANFTATYITLYCGHNSIVILCQGFLFLPKIVPPIRRRLNAC